MNIFSSMFSGFGGFGADESGPGEDQFTAEQKMDQYGGNPLLAALEQTFGPRRGGRFPFVNNNRNANTQNFSRGANDWRAPGTDAHGTGYAYGPSGGYGGYGGGAGGLTAEQLGY